MMKKEKNGTELLGKLWDVRVFGGMVPDEARVVGAVHCEWATSLHPVKIEIAKITSPFSSTETKTKGSFGKKYFIPNGLYVAGWTYSANRRENFQKFAGVSLSVRDMELFEEGLKYGCSYGRTSAKGFIETLMIVKVIKEERVKSRFDALSEEIEVEMKNDMVMSSKDIKLKLSKLKKVLNHKDYKEIQVYVSESAERKYKELRDFKKRYGELEVKEEHLSTCWEYVVIYEVKHSNPNGDPDRDNMPRRWDGTDIGIISPERQKRWIRDYIEDKGEMIFLTRKGKVQKAKERMKEIEKLL